MTLKYIYSPMIQRFKHPRHIKVNEWDAKQLTPASDRGSAIDYGRIMDTGIPYPTMDQLINDRYAYHQEVLAEEGYAGDGFVFVNDDNNIFNYWFAAEHEIRKPGKHYIIEYNKSSQTSTQPLVEDYSPLYEDYKEAVHHIQKHVAAKVKALDDHQYELEVSDNKNHYRIVHGPYDENRDISPQSRLSDYRIIELEVPEEIYEEASDVPSEKYLVMTPHSHFERPPYMQTEGS